MNLGRSHVGRRELMDQERIERIAVGELPHAARDRCTSLLLAELLDERGIGGLKLPEQRRPDFGEQLPLTRGGQAERSEPPLEVRIDGAVRPRVVGRSGDDVARAFGQERIHAPEHVNALPCLSSHVRDEVTERRDDGADSLDVGLRIARVVEGLLAGQRAGDVDVQADDLIQRVEMIAPPIAIEEQLLLVDEHPVLQLRGRVEFGVVEAALRRLDVPAVLRGAGGKRALGLIVPPILALPSSRIRSRAAGSRQDFADRPIRGTRRSAGAQTCAPARDAPAPHAPARSVAIPRTPGRPAAGGFGQIPRRRPDACPYLVRTVSLTPILRYPGSMNMPSTKAFS